MPPISMARRRAVMKEYGIRIHHPLSPDEWPAHSRKLFSEVQSSSNVDYDYWKSYTNSDKTIPGRLEFKMRAELICKLARDLRDETEQKLEADWRHTLEPEVFKRFQLEVTCHVCTGRLWRADTEVDAELNKSSKSALFDRQQRREMCTCDSSTASVEVNRLFGVRIEHVIKYDAELTDKLGQGFEKPDRMYGLRRAGRVERFMFLRANRAVGEAGASQMQLRSSPIKDDTITLFPFLVMEAKSEISGSAPSAVQSQTAFAARECLLIQKSLQVASKGEDIDEEPVVWCLSNRGETWELSAAYIAGKRSCSGDIDDNGVDIMPLWKGDITSREGALRLLLKMDYIFDWARDKYRERIITQLRRLAASTSLSIGPSPIPRCSVSTVVSISRSETDQIIETSNDQASVMTSFAAASRVEVEFADNEPESARQTTENVTTTHQSIQFWSSTVQNDHVILDREEEAGRTDPLRKFDNNHCAFRDPTFIHSRVMGLYITQDNIDRLFLSRNTDAESERLLRSVLIQLQKETVLKMRNETLAAMEAGWAGVQQNQHEVKDASEELYVILTFSAYLTPEWEQVRELSYLAVSTKVLGKLGQLGKKSIRFRSLPTDTELMISLIEVFLAASVSTNLAACLYRVSIAPCFVNGSHEDNIFADKPTLRPCVMVPTYKRRPRDFIWELYKRHRVGRNELPAPYLRVSSRLDAQMPHSTSDACSKTGSPWTTYVIADTLVLSHNQNPRTVHGYVEWCFFFLDLGALEQLLVLIVLERHNLKSAHLTHRLGPDGGWKKVHWNRTNERTGDSQSAKVSKIAFRFLETLRSALVSHHLSGRLLGTADDADAAEETLDQISLPDSDSDESSFLTQTTEGDDSDSTVTGEVGSLNLD